jgi:isopenicillin N synthase-like dioxygenase
LHRLNDDSGDFVRVLRYPGVPFEHQNCQDGFPPHKDAMSVAILFTWLGGLQIPNPNAEIQGLCVKPEDWCYVRPEPGYAIVNLGDAMEIFTNKVLKSGIHRVVKAPGEQRPHDRLSVLVATRPENNSPMKAFESSVIPFREHDAHFMTSLEWGHSVIVGIRNQLQAEAIARGSTSFLANA